MHQQINIPIGNLPLQLVCISNGTLGIVPTMSFKTIIDSYDDTAKVDAIISEDAIKIVDKEQQKEYSYKTAYEYKYEPLLKRWLVQQDLLMPQF